MFLANFEPFSHNVTHLSIYIEGPNVFTRNNYVKPEITIQEEVLIMNWVFTFQPLLPMTSLRNTLPRNPSSRAQP